MVRLELWHGARGDREKLLLHEFERLVPELAVSDAVWHRADDIARRCRAAGVTVPATDVLIQAVAAHHGATLEHADQDLARLAAVLTG